MRIAQITDLHVGGDDVAAYYGLDTRTALKRAIDQINALDPRPDVCLVTGDIVESATPQEYALARSALQRLSMPWYAIPGNHDERGEFRRAFAGTLTPRGEDEFVQYVIDDFPLRIIALDSIVARRTHGELCSHRLRWLDRTLAAAPGLPAVIMLHHPPFETHQPLIDGMCLSNPASFADVIRRHPQVEAIISGHVHRAIHSRVAHAQASSCPSTAHQMALALDRQAPIGFTHEPAGFQLHVWDGPGSWTTHTVQTGCFAGPFAFH